MRPMGHRLIMDAWVKHCAARTADSPSAKVVLMSGIPQRLFVGSPLLLPVALAEPCGGPMGAPLFSLEIASSEPTTLPGFRRRFLILAG
jgi:hypothetical protein